MAARCRTSDTRTRATVPLAVGSVTAASYVPDVSVTRTAYYYVVVTNTNNGINSATTATATSSVVAVRLSVEVDGLSAYLGNLADNGW